MKRINGKCYRKFKGWTGRVYLVEMDRSEVIKEELYKASVILMPLFLIVIWALAAGMI